MLDRTAFAVRIGRLRDGPAYSGALLLVPDEARFRQARRLLRSTQIAWFIALERDAARESGESPIWRTPSGGPALSLTEALGYVRPEGQWAVERTPRRSQPPRSLAARTGGSEPERLLAVRLKTSEKRTLDLVGDWPWIRPDHLAALLGVARRRVSQLTAGLQRRELLSAPRIEGRRRLALTDRGPGPARPPRPRLGRPGAQALERRAA